MDPFLYKFLATIVLATIPVFPQTIESQNVEVTELKNSTITRTVIEPINQEELDRVAAEKEAARIAAEIKHREETAARERLQLPLPEGSYSYTSDFGPRCDAGIATGPHYGIDLAAAYGTPMFSISAGEVTRVVDGAGDTAGVVIIKSVVNGQALNFVYYHMENSSQYVSVGDTVTPGQRISSVASTGRSTGPHLHLEIWANGDYREGNGTAIDPAKYFSSIGLPVIEKATADYSTGDECPTGTPFNTSPQNEG